MISYRRSAYVFVMFADRGLVNLSAFFSGTTKVERRTDAVGISLLTGKTRLLDEAAMLLMHSLNSKDWISANHICDTSGVDLVTLDELASDGFLLSNGEDSESIKLRDCDRFLDESNWNPYQALAYVMSRWPYNGPVEEPESELMNALDNHEELVRAYGFPPSHFHHVDSDIRLDLAPPGKGGKVLETLLARRSCRGFQTDREMPATTFSTLMRYTFGYNDTMKVAEGYTVLRKTSPSGGALHPIEAYPLVLNVEGIATGLYHYSVENHDLALIKAFDLEQGRDQAKQMLAGQWYFSSANVVVLLTARFERHFWKYRNDHKSLRVVEMDAAHLSQTFQLLGHELGMGTFVTAAVVDQLVEDLLKLAPLKEGVMLAIGCGYPSNQSVPGGIPFDSEGSESV